MQFTPSYLYANMYKRNEVIKLRLSDIVKNYRMQNGLTQNDLAKLAKCSKPYISMIENGKDSKTGKSINHIFAQFSDCNEYDIRKII